MRTIVTIPRHYILGLPVKEPLARVENFPGPRPEPVSPDFAASYAIFQEGYQAYRTEDYHRAADRFVRAAPRLRVRDGIHAHTASGNRSVLYEDAAYAWLMADAADTGRKTLRDLERSGKAAADDVRRGLAALDGP